jgi:hypothetical protein
MKTTRPLARPQPAFLIAALALFLPLHAAPSAADPLAEGFTNPPRPAWPRTWWHWTRSNITTETIAKNLEWMKRVGPGAFMRPGM